MSLFGCYKGAEVQNTLYTLGYANDVSVHGTSRNKTWHYKVASVLLLRGSSCHETCLLHKKNGMMEWILFFFFFSQIEHYGYLRSILGNPFCLPPFSSEVVALLIFFLAAKPCSQQKRHGTSLVFVSAGSNSISGAHWIPFDDGQYGDRIRDAAAAAAAMVHMAL